jgi:anaerobic dimethyl sulfoxide reductase subunit A
VRQWAIGKNPINARVSSPLLADLLAYGKAGGYPADIKLIYAVTGDLFNQAPNINKMVAALDGVEFIVGQDNFLTPTVRYADIVLPATTFWERNDVHTPWAGALHYAIFMRQAIEPMYECRNDIDIFADLAKRVGVDGYSDKSEMAWLRELTADAVDDFDAFVEQGVARFPAPEDVVAFAKQIRDPDNHKFSTPSGKIEIYSMALAANPDPYGLGYIPAIPSWIPPASAPATYPLAFCSPKSRARTHSVHGNQPRLARVDPDCVWMHPDDAQARGIADGDEVRVFNERGATVLPARVTDRIAPGVVSIKEGAWHTPGQGGTDMQGCGNVLTADRSAPCGATTYNTNAVEIEAADPPVMRAG